MKSINHRNLITGEIFHVFNRGVDKRIIFLDDKDYLRFIHDLFEFNDTKAAFNFGRFFQGSQLIDFRNQSVERGKKEPRKLIVEVLAFCLMPNHFHLLLRQRIDGGITNFMRKLGVGYANYFNQKYKRTGTLFQGKYKVVLVGQEAHFNHLPYYIHLNPLDLIEPSWRIGKIKNYQKAIEFLEHYRWSSHLDYLGRKNFPSVTQRDFYSEISGGSDNYEGDIKNWLREINLNSIEKMVLE